jgi:MazG family protein
VYTLRRVDLLGQAERNASFLAPAGIRSAKCVPGAGFSRAGVVDPAETFFLPHAGERHLFMDDRETPPATAGKLVNLLNLVRTLRSENGCPWDKKQTPEGFHHYILEEYHELVQAIHTGDRDAVADEMGDLLFLVLFMARMLEQEGMAPMDRVLDGAHEKMVRRHPHVFGKASADTPEEVLAQWSKIKAGEETIRARVSLLDGVPRSLPGLARAQKLANRAAKVGFDWTDSHGVFDKIDEELAEFKEAVALNSENGIREELGDLLFVTVNAARHLGINGEAALNETSDKFERRFRHIESRLRERGVPIQQASLGLMDEFWDEAKSFEKRTNRERKG